MEKSSLKMETEPVGKLLVNMSLPVIISMLIQSMYNIIDSIFVSRINEHALAAVSIAFPIQTFMLAVALGTGVGINALVSRSLGEKNNHKANRIAENGMFLSIIYFILFSTAGFFFAKTYMEIQTSNGEIIQYGREYLSIVTGFSLFLFVQLVLEKIMNATGRTVFTMMSQSVGAIVNIVLDPIFIFGLFGLPAMGIKGAAYATVIGQLCAALLNISFIFKRIDEVKIKSIKPQWSIIKHIYQIGLPSIILIALGSLTVFSLNKIMNKFSTTAVAMLGVYFKLQSFAFMPIFGLNNGMVPIVSYNYGARNPERIREAIRKSIIIAVSMAVVSLTIFQVFPDELLQLFNASEAMAKIGRPALKIISLSYIFAAIDIVSAAVFQALGNAVLSMIISMTRQLFVLVPVAYFISLRGNIDMVWFAFLIAEVVSLFLCLLFQKIFVNKELENLV